jgi:protein O-mannosyl-transferase
MNPPMPRFPPASRPPARSANAHVRLIAAGLLAAVALAYHNSLSVPFVFDDPLAVLENPTIRRLWPITDVLIPPRGEGLTVEGRPVLNLTLALNYAAGGTSVRGYHVANILIHWLGALTLFGVVRRALLLPRLHERFGAAAMPLAAIVAFLWALHPLQSAAITYVIQRAEALVTLFYLLTFYCFVRGVQATGTAAPQAAASVSEWTDAGSAGVPRRWFALAVVACLVGMATKEVMVSAPLMLLFFDRALVGGSFAEAWRRRRWVHLALFATWLLLALLVASTGTRGGTAGFGINVTPWTYALTQFEAVTRYVWLSFWPHPLIFDYGVAWVERAGDVLPFALVLLSLIAATLVAWWRWPAAAFPAVLFFAVLSPTSSIVPGNRQTLAEHRMYLPLAAVLVLVVCGLHRLSQRRATRRRLFAAAALVALGFGVLTVRRNEDYRSELVLYRDTVEKRPRNGFARYNLGKAYAEADLHEQAIPQYQAALRLMGEVPGVHYNLANSLAALGRAEDAAAGYRAALRAEPRYARAHFNLGNVLVELGRKEEALGHFATAAELEPEFVEARVNQGGVLLELGRLAEAREQLERVLRTEPGHALAHFNLGNVCLLEQRWADAIRHFEAVIALRPDLTVAHERLELARSRTR